MRLIDADALMRKLTYSPNGVRYREFDCDNFPSTLTLRYAKKLVRDEPTVSPWVKTADRLPEDHEMLNGCVLIVDERGYGSVQKRRVLERYPRDYPWWLPIPALPEKEDGTPVIGMVTRPD